MCQMSPEVREITGERLNQGLYLGLCYLFAQKYFCSYLFSDVFFHYSLNSQLLWIFPPQFLNPFNPIMIPLLNSLLLISSGCRVTIAHHRVLMNNKLGFILFIAVTVILGMFFSIIQVFEYILRNFCINDRNYARIFFIATGFHGAHVIIGTTYNLVSIVIRVSFSRFNHLGLEFSIWYWHFVDVVWLFLYSFIYWWRI